MNVSFEASEQKLYDELCDHLSKYYGISRFPELGKIVIRKNDKSLPRLQEITLHVTEIDDGIGEYCRECGGLFDPSELKPYTVQTIVDGFKFPKDEVRMCVDCGCPK